MVDYGTYLLSSIMNDPLRLYSGSCQQRPRRKHGLRQPGPLQFAESASQCVAYSHRLHHTVSSITPAHQ